MTDGSADYDSCPICGNSAQLAYDHPDSEIWRCTACDHAYTRLDTMRKVEDYSAAYYDDEHKNWFANPHTALFQWIGDNIPSGARNVIDIGCGRGDFLEYLRKTQPELELIGVDLSPNEPSPGITYIQKNIMEMEIERQFDVVVSLAAIEHMEDPLSFARRLKEFCAPNGVIVVMTVNESGLFYSMARMARRMGMPMVFNRLYSAHHLNHFSVKSLERLLNNAGMDVEKTHHHNSPLAAVDLPSSLVPVRWLVLAVLAGIFALGKALSMGLSQTVIARPRKHELQK